MTSSFDMSEIRNALKRLEGVRKETKSELVQSAAKGFIKTVVAITPPARNGSTGSDAKKAGEKTVASDVSRIFSVISPKERAILMASPTPGEHHKTFAHAGAAAIGEVTDKVLSRSQMLQWLNARRNKSTGRVGKIKGGAGTTNWERALGVTTGLRAADLAKLGLGLVSKEDYAWFVKEVQKQVGLLAAGWNAAAEKLGVKVPAWVKRHGTGHGSVVVTITSTKFRMELSNATKFVGNVKGYEERIQRAINYQAASMQRMADHLMKKAIQNSRL